jgi:hypothetical protein
MSFYNVFIVAKRVKHCQHVSVNNICVKREQSTEEYQWRNLALNENCLHDLLCPGNR